MCELQHFDNMGQVGIGKKGQITGTLNLKDIEQSRKQ